ITDAVSYFIFSDLSTTKSYTLSLHDALPIWGSGRRNGLACSRRQRAGVGVGRFDAHEAVARPVFRECDVSVLRTAISVREDDDRSEEHTSELQSQSNLVCRLLLEKKKKLKNY